MTDLEKTKLCWQAMGDLPAVVEHEGQLRFGYQSCMGPAYDPLHDDAQAMALVKRFNLALSYEWEDGKPIGCYVREPHSGRYHHVGVLELNRAIVDCVAKMEADKQARETA